MTKTAAIARLIDRITAHAALASVTAITVRRASVAFESADPHALSAIKHLAIRAGAKTFTETDHFLVAKF